MSEVKHASIAYEVESHPELHCTVLYLGQIKHDRVLENSQELSFEVACRRLEKVRLNSALKVLVHGLAYFGPNSDIPVALVHHDLLHSVRSRLLLFFENGSEFVHYNPHITIPDPDDPQYRLDHVVWLDGLHLSWGDEEKVYLR